MTHPPVTVVRSAAARRAGPAPRARVAALILAAGASLLGTARAAEVPAGVLDAERQRVEVMARASQAAVAIFAGEAGGDRA